MNAVKFDGIYVKKKEERLKLDIKFSKTNVMMQITHTSLPSSKSL